MKKVCSYTRFDSSSTTFEKIEEQQKMIANTLEQHKDWDNLQNFVDIAVPSLKDKMSTGNNILTLAKEGKVELLIIPSISMLGINAEDVREFMENLHSYGCNMFFIKENIFTDAEICTSRMPK